MIKVQFFTSKTFPVDNGNRNLLFCGSASINTGNLALNNIILKFNRKTGNYFLQFPQHRGNDGKYRPVFCTITKKARENLTRIIVAEAQKAWAVK